MPYSAPDGVSRLTFSSAASPLRQDTRVNNKQLTKDYNNKQPKIIETNKTLKEPRNASHCSKVESAIESTNFPQTLLSKQSRTDENMDLAKSNSHSLRHNSKFLLYQDEEDDGDDYESSHGDRRFIPDSRSKVSTIRSSYSAVNRNVDSSAKTTRPIVSQLSLNTRNLNSSKFKHTTSTGVTSAQGDLSYGGLSKLPVSLAEVLKFPRESTHAYSYAYLSPNSLAVRLSILKRSLEILIDRPELMIEQSSGNAKKIFEFDIENFITQIRTEDTLQKDQIRPERGESASKLNKKFGYSNNASSAALSALFDLDSSSNVVGEKSEISQEKTSISVSSNDKITTDGLRTLLRIIGTASTFSDENQSKKSNRKEIATNLLELSLTSTQADLTESDQRNEEVDLKIKLLHALATPFYEPVASAPLLSFNNNNASTVALSSLASPSNQLSSPAQQPTERPFHGVPQKNSSPQAVFTCTYSDPWDLKAANDLACLIFGVSRSSLKRLTLLDLVAPDSRDFVLNKLVSNSINYTSYNNDMVFSGEIIAISKPGNKLTWASLWAKRKGNLIICMFDQVPCDSIDVTVRLSDFKILALKHISDVSNLFTDSEKLESITDLVRGLETLVDSKRGLNTNVPLAIWDSQIISQQRYFTIKGQERSDFSAPCAVTSKVIDDIDAKIKLRIHSLPYIAGVFLISSLDFNVLSMNESVAKNLFGLKDSDLIGKSICRIIPRFSDIMGLIKSRYSNLPFRQGLVLPEHFFRQVNALLTKGGESNFLQSIGIDGTHSDGATIKIDVQLRCSTNDTFLLWVTHSRSVYSKHLDQTKRTDGPSSSPDQGKGLNDDIGLHSSTNSSTSAVFDQNMPSQLKMLNEENVATLSRASSIKTRPKSGDDSSRSVQEDNIDQDETTAGIESQNDESEHTDMNEFHFKALDMTLNESELLRIENETIERTQSYSKAYPKTIGLKRREKSINEFKIIKKMGQGAYGRVVLCENIKDPNYRVVIKLIIKERILVDTWVRDRKLGTIPSEIQIMATLNSNPHPNIMRLIDFFEDDQYYYIETPPHGNPIPAIDVYDLIELKKNMTEYECQSIIKQCVNALNHLHKCGVVHRDIKDENLIIDVNGIIKLIDFGSAAYVKQGPFDVFVGTIDYAAPEVLNGSPYEGKPQDIWSLGILIYTLVYKETPFYNVDEIMEGELRLPPVFSEGCTNLIKSILIRDVRKRPTIEEIMEDPWLNKV